MSMIENPENIKKIGFLKHQDRYEL